jgi:hypothetical protein
MRGCRPTWLSTAGSWWESFGALQQHSSSSRQQGPQGVQARAQARGTTAAGTAAADLQAGRLELLLATVVVTQVLLGQCMQ